MRRSVVLLACMALAVILASGVALAAAGDLDPAFDDAGKFVLEEDSADGFTGSFNAVAVHPDGGLVGVGFYSGLTLVVRLQSDGSLDSSFGGGDGVVTTSLGGAFNGSPEVVVRPDGKIVVADADGPDRVALLRYHADGRPDTSFGGGDGIVLTDPPGSSFVGALLRQPDGKLVVGGRTYTSSSQDFLLVRYHADGRPDTSFGGGDGIVLTDVSNTTNLGFQDIVGTVRDLVWRSDGKLVVAGNAYRSGHLVDFALVRYNPNGTVDENFGGGDGRAYTDFGDVEYANALVRQNGAFVAAGYKKGTQQWKVALARFTSDGRLDQSFGGGDGKVLTAIGPGGYSRAHDLVAQEDGKLVAAGTSTGDFANNDFALARYHPGGQLDTSFGGGDGKVLTDFGASETADGLALQTNGKIVAAGYTGDFSTEDPTDAAVARYLAE